MGTIITGTGSYIPNQIKSNTHFMSNEFYADNNHPLTDKNEVIIKKFKDITGIEERRYISQELSSSDAAAIAARKAIDDAKIDPETIDQIIVAHNFGNLAHDSNQSDMLPSLASKVKHLLAIDNPNCVAYDVIFGCPGWVQGMIQADIFIKAGMAQRCLIIGSETLMDSRIYFQSG